MNSDPKLALDSKPWFGPYPLALTVDRNIKVTSHGSSSR